MRLPELASIYHRAESLSVDRSSKRDAFLRAHQFIESWDASFADLVQGSEGVVADSTVIHPSAVIGESVFICAGARIGPHCFIKSRSIIGPGVTLGFSVEVDRLIILEGSKIAHTACVGRSIFSSGCNFGYNFVNATANIYGKGLNYCYSPLHRKRSTASHHGAVIAEGVRTGVNVATMPGASIESGAIIGPFVSVQGYLCRDER